MVARDGWLRRLGPWAAIGTSPAAMMMGGGVASGLEGAALAAALGLGVVALTAVAVLQGALGQRSGRRLGALVAGPLGRRAGRRTAAAVVLAMMVGWFGVNVGVAGEATARLLELPGVGGIAVFALLMLAVVTRGLGTLSWAALAAGIATVGIAAYGLALALDTRDVGVSASDTAQAPTAVVPGIAVVVGYGAAFALRAPDFVGDLERTRQVLWCALAGLLVPLAAFALAGAALWSRTGSWDLADVLQALDASTIAYLLLAVGFSGSVLTNLYSGALSLQELTPGAREREALVVVAGAGTALAAAGLAERMLDYLTFMALVAPGLIALCALDAILPARRRTTARVGLLAWIGGAALGVALDLAGFALALPAALVATLAIPLVVSRRAPRSTIEPPTSERRFGDTG